MRLAGLVLYEFRWTSMAGIFRQTHQRLSPDRPRQGLEVMSYNPRKPNKPQYPEPPLDPNTVPEIDMNSRDWLENADTRARNANENVCPSRKYHDWGRQIRTYGTRTPPPRTFHLCEESTFVCLTCGASSPEIRTTRQHVKAGAYYRFINPAQTSYQDNDPATIPGWRTTPTADLTLEHHDWEQAAFQSAGHVR